jgi:hypothetical protein
MVPSAPRMVMISEAFWIRERKRLSLSLSASSNLLRSVMSRDTAHNAVLPL